MLQEQLLRQEVSLEIRLVRLSKQHQKSHGEKFSIFHYRVTRVNSMTSFPRGFAFYNQETFVVEF